MRHAPRGVCLMCGQPGAIGLCSARDVLRDLDGMALHAMWDALPRHRAEYWRVFLARRIEEAEQNRRAHVTLDLERARVLRDAWAAVEFEAGAREEMLEDVRGLHNERAHATGA